MESVSNHQGRMAWGVWPQWVLASAVGFTIGSLLGSGFLSGIAVTVGVVQWLVLRRYLPSASRWILATFVGTEVGIFLGWLVGLYGQLLGLSGLNILVLLAVGTPVCIAQWLFLRTRVRKAFLWLVPGILLYSIGFYWIGVELAYRVALPLFGVPEFEGTSYYLSEQSMYALRATQGAFTGVATGTLMGILLAWLVRHPRSV